MIRFLKKNGIKIFWTTIKGANKITNHTPFTNLSPMPKQLLFDFSTVDTKIDNIEGMTFGPELSNGKKSLILVSDNNFNANQKTIFYTLSIEFNK